MESLSRPEYAAETDELLRLLGDTSGEPTMAELRASRVSAPDETLAGTPASVSRAELFIPTRGGPRRVFVYRPEERPAPVLLWLHGGGFVGGSLEDIDTACSHLSRESGAVVVSLDYRLAPEHPYPAGLFDTYDAMAWLRGEGDLLGGDGRLWVGGQSAGAALVAGATLLARDLDQFAIDGQVLCYPTLQFTHDTESAALYEGVFLHLHGDRWITRAYLAGRSADEYAAPLLAPSLSGLPPTLLVGAGRDPLRDDARLFAQRLASAGVAMRHVEVADTMHAFLNFPGALSAAYDVIDWIAQRLRSSGLSTSIAA